jgi:DUF1680 family protein
MPVRLIEAHPRVADDAGRWAVMRGPLVYCVEQADHSGIDLESVVLPRETAFAGEWRPELLGGVLVLTTRARLDPPDPGWHGRLYRTATSAATDRAANPDVAITAIPYYAWANREAGPMQVWIRHE